MTRSGTSRTASPDRVQTSPNRHRGRSGGARRASLTQHVPTCQGAEKHGYHVRRPARPPSRRGGSQPLPWRRSIRPRRSRQRASAPREAAPRWAGKPCDLEERDVAVTGVAVSPGPSRQGPRRDSSVAPRARRERRRETSRGGFGVFALEAPAVGLGVAGPGQRVLDATSQPLLLCQPPKQPTPLRQRERDALEAVHASYLLNQIDLSGDVACPPGWRRHGPVICLVGSSHLKAESLEDRPLLAGADRRPDQRGRPRGTERGRELTSWTALTSPAESNVAPDSSTRSSEANVAANAA